MMVFGSAKRRRRPARRQVPQGFPSVISRVAPAAVATATVNSLWVLGMEGAANCGTLVAKNCGTGGLLEQS